MRDTFIQWVDDRYGIRLDVDFRKNEKGLYTYLKRFNFERTNDVLGRFSRAICQGDSDYIEAMRESIPEEMKGIPIMGRGRPGCG